MKKFLIFSIAVVSISAGISATVLCCGRFHSGKLKKSFERSGLNEKEMLSNKDKFSIRVYKEKKNLELLYDGKVVKTYRVSTGPGVPEGSGSPGKVSPGELFFRSLSYHEGDKTTQGDLTTPEGVFRLVTDFRPAKKFYRFALLSYPQDAKNRKSKNPGGDVGIHGMGPKWDKFGHLHTLIRHTRGCIALNNGEIDELASVTGRGTIVEILP